MIQQVRSVSARRPVPTFRVAMGEGVMPSRYETHQERSARHRDAAAEARRRAQGSSSKIAWERALRAAILAADREGAIECAQACLALPESDHTADATAYARNYLSSLEAEGSSGLDVTA